MLHVQDIGPLLWQCPKILCKRVVISDIIVFAKTKCFLFSLLHIVCPSEFQYSEKIRLILRFIFHLLLFRCLLNFSLLFLYWWQTSRYIWCQNVYVDLVPKRVGPKRLGAKTSWCQNIRLRQIEIQSDRTKISAKCIVRSSLIAIELTVAPSQFNNTAIDNQILYT